jgi:hypothetical protein
MADRAIRAVTALSPSSQISDEEPQASTNNTRPRRETSSGLPSPHMRATNDPPPFPNMKGLTPVERNAARRVFEKAMYQYIDQHGTLSTEVCGPCQRTGTRCIRHPIVRKCALCFRGHDVCEIWDDSVETVGGRRAPKKLRRVDSPKKDETVLPKRL